MEDASNGCVTNHKVVTKPSVEDTKPKYVNPYRNKPIFRRKLIEKYSTARYNINTKRVLIKKSPPSKTQCNGNTAKIPHENDNSPQIEDLQSSPGSSKSDSTSTTPTARKLVYDEGSTNTILEDDALKTTKPDEASSNESLFSHAVQSEGDVSSANKHDREDSRKRKFSSTASSSLGSKATWRIAPKTVYNNLWDLYQSTVEIKIEEPDPEPDPKKETKKRKNIWTKKRYRRKPLPSHKKVADRIHFDPYVECLKEAETQSTNASHGPINDKLGIVMYLGVNRPLFPLIYRNLRVLNDSNDEKITDFWSEFALSTLITKPEDRKYKPILVPVKDPELAALVSECLEEIAPPNVLNVSNALSASNESLNVSKAVSASNESLNVSKAVSASNESLNVSKAPFASNETSNVSNASSASDNDTARHENNVEVRIKQEENDVSPVPQKKRRTKSWAVPKSYELRRTIMNYNRVFEEGDSEPEKPAIIEPITPTVTSSPESKPQPSPKRPILDEKAILKKFGYKDCFVAIPKLSETLIKYLSAGNYSNQSAELKDPTERELIEETDDFGLIQCTRTDGIIIDYVTRNRSLVYFYKLKKMLDFQKTNNKYFVCCDYILIDNTAGDEDVDVVSIPDDEEYDKSVATTSGPRNSKNPNDLFKSSKISEWKDKSNNISWVKNNDLKSVSDHVKWLLISLDKHIASLSHTSGCVLRYRLLFEIIYRAELSKKVICCELSKASGTASDTLTFGVYAFPGLCDKVLVGPYLFHEEHQLSAFIRTSNGSSERALIKTLEEKENFPQSGDSSPVKHINAKWWSGKNNNDLTEQYLNFFFNPSAVKCVQTTDRLSLTKIMADHPCHNCHAYEITGRESNLVLVHDRTNADAKNAVASTEIPVQIATTDVTTVSSRTKKVPPLTLPPTVTRNLRKKPRQDYSQLITDDMAVHPRAKNSVLHIVDVKSLRKRPTQSEIKAKRALRNEMKEKLKRVSRYQESPETHILNERLRRLEFRNRRNDLASVLEARPTGSYNSQPLISILNQAKEIITYLEVDNNKLDEEGKRLRLEQSMLMRTFLAKLRSLDIKSETYKKGMVFVTSWKQIKADHRNKLINILGQNFDKPKANKTSESSRTVAAKRPVSAQRSVSNRSLQRHWSNLKKSPPERALFDNRGDLYTVRDHDSHFSRDENIVQRTMSRIKKRQRMRDVLRNRSNSHQVAVESAECEISEQVVCVDGKSSDPLGANHMLDDMGEVPIIISNMPPDVDPYAVDPLADDDDDDASSSIGKYSASGINSLYAEHSYCSAASIGNEPINSCKKIGHKRTPLFRNLPVRSALQIVPTWANGYRPNRPIVPQFRSLLPASPTITSPFRPNNPIIGNRVSSLQLPMNSIRVRSPRPVSLLAPKPTPPPPRAPASTTPTFQIRINDSADENLGIDILDNGRMFARLNIAKINNGGNPNTVNKTTGSSSTSRRAGIAGTATSNKIMTIIQRFLQQMEKTSPSTDADDDERAKQAKRKYVVNSLKSFISKFENRRKNLEDVEYSSNSDDISSPNIINSIELESGYSSKSEESSDRDYDAKTREPSVIAERIVEDEATIESIVLDGDDDEQESEEAETEIEEQVEEVLADDEFMAEEEEEEEIIGEEELIEEEEEEEEIGLDENTLQEMNDVDAAMRVDETDPFANSDESADETPAAEYRDNDEPNTDSLNSTTERTELPERPPKVIYTTNQFTIIRPKSKFVPNIMKTPTKITVKKDSASDHLSRIQIKPSVGSLVKLSTASLQLAPTEKISKIPLSSGNSDSIIKRLWYSPVSKTDETDLKVLRRESSLNEMVKTHNIQIENVISEDDPKNSEDENSNDETASDTEKDSSGANRIVIKSFANHQKFREAFLSNVDKLLNPES